MSQIPTSARYQRFRHAHLRNKLCYSLMQFHGPTLYLSLLTIKITNKINLTIRLVVQLKLLLMVNSEFLLQHFFVPLTLAGFIRPLMLTLVGVGLQVIAFVLVGFILTFTNGIVTVTMPSVNLRPFTLPLVGNISTVLVVCR